MSKIPQFADFPETDRRAQLTRIRFVLVETSLSGNIGAVARAMKNMGLARIELVRPKRFPDADAVARASGADDLLAAAGVHDDLPSALTGCRLVVGSSARLRSVAWPQIDPAECGRRLLEEACVGEAALVLGRESSGLTNDELGHCHYLAHIESDPDFSSLNIAAAAQLFAYEIRRSWLAQSATTVGSAEVAANTADHRFADEVQPATADEMDGFHAHLAQTLTAIGFADPEQSKKLLRRLRRLFNRARPSRTELNILRGILSAAQGRKRPDRFTR
jgi:tRNA (cytidine32/uridine32-2'-O)-methyltransferase